MRRQVDPDSLMTWVQRDDSGCWNFTGEVRPNGYAHRVYYERLVGVIPDGLELDHLCRNRRCVNPNHLEVVTGHINIVRSSNPAGINSRKTHCSNGHEYTPENTNWRPRADRHPWRQCRTCAREWSRVSAERRRLGIMPRAASPNVTI